MIELIIIFSIMLIAFVVFKVGDIFSPWTITTGVWLAILLMFTQYGDMLYPLEEKFYYCVSLWVPIMSVSAILTYYSLPEKTITQQEMAQPIAVNHKFFMLFLIISITLTPLYLYQIYKVVSMFSTENLLTNLRILTLGENDDIGTGILKYVRAVNQTLFIMAVWRYPDIKKWQLYSIIIANILCAIAIMEKGSIFFMLIVTVFVLYQKGKIKISKIIIIGVVLLFAFYGFNLLRSAKADPTENNSFLDFFSLYVLSPSVAFGQVQEKLTEQFGSRTFAFFYAILSKLGIGNYVHEPMLQEFVMVPIATNVYTIFQPFYEDFGYKGIAFFATVYGVFTGWLYRLCRNGGAISKCFYAYVAEVLMLQFFQESLILSLSLLLQYTIVFSLTLQRFVGFARHNESGGNGDG